MHPKAKMGEPFDKKGKIYQIIKEKKQVTLVDLRHLTNINYNTIRSSVNSLTKERVIERVNRGTYKSR